MNKLLDQRYGNHLEDENENIFQGLSLLVLFLGTVIGIFILISGFQYNEKEVNASIQINITPEQFHQEFEALTKKVEEPYKNGTDYFETLRRIEYLTVAAKKLEGTVGYVQLVGTEQPQQVPYNWAIVQLGTLEKKNTARMYGVNFDYGDFEVARDAYEANLKANPLPQPTVDSKLSLNFLFASKYWLSWYILGILLAFPNFLINIRLEGGRILPAILSLDVFGWSLAWVVYAWIRPTHMTIREQFSRMRKSLSYVFGSVATVAGYIVPVLAQAEGQVPTSVARKKSSTKVSGDSEFWTQYIADNGRVFSNKPYLNQSVTIEKGSCSVSFGISQSVGTKLGKLDGANAYSIFGGCGKTIKGMGLSLNGGYINLDRYSEFKNDYVVIGGSVKAPTKTYQKFTAQPFVNADYYFGTSKGNKGGLLVGTGASFNLQITSKLKLSSTPKLMWDIGAFGNNRAIIGIIYSKLELKLSKSFTWRVVQHKGSIPLSKLNDGRKPAMQWGTGFAYQF